jgi:hypothetical protein
MVIVNDRIKIGDIFYSIEDIINGKCNPGVSIEIMDELIKIHNRLDNMVIVKEITIKEPRFDYPRTQKRLAQTIITPPTKVIEDYIIDQTIRNGYTEGYKIYIPGGYTFSDKVFWIIYGYKRKLVPMKVPHKKGTNEANNFILEISKMYESYNLQLNKNELRYNG